ncbi:MAG: hypothetical protein Q8Q30_00120 [Candidatus Woesebacteria bacterium]|nr:hypothetical protein [Candidatus Woesebacteria bacterium]
MSLDIESSFAKQYNEHKGTESYLVVPHMIGHVFMDWMDVWIKENPNNELTEKLNSPSRPIPSVRKVFGIFINRLKNQSVEMPKKLQAEVLKEYLAD